MLFSIRCMVEPKENKDVYFLYYEWDWKIENKRKKIVFSMRDLWYKLVQLLDIRDFDNLILDENCVWCITNYDGAVKIAEQATIETLDGMYALPDWKSLGILSCYIFEWKGRNLENIYTNLLFNESGF